MTQWYDNAGSCFLLLTHIIRTEVFHPGGCYPSTQSVAHQWVRLTTRGNSGTLFMIKGFKDKDTEDFYHDVFIRRFSGFARQAERRLRILNDAEVLQDLQALPSNRLEKLGGDREGQYSIRINQQWRICFRWDDDGPDDVEIVDYH